MKETRGQEEVTFPQCWARAVPAASWLSDGSCRLGKTRGVRSLKISEIHPKSEQPMPDRFTFSS